MAKRIHELFNLNGKVSIVTGAAMGIGKGIALRLAEAGASVVVADINLEEASKTSDEMTAAGYKVKAVQADASKLADIERVIATTIDTFGDLHILVNNAGIYPFAPSLEMPEALWNKTIDINLKGYMFFAQAAAKAMLSKNHGGKIINIASIDSFHPTGNLAHYDASKGGVIMLTKALGKEWAPMGILVNAIAPGAVLTPGGASSMDFSKMTREQIEGMSKAFLDHIPLGRQGEPDDIAKIALFLASEAADYMVGATIIADGGYLVG
ncbi:MAG TPA: SDR family oxidoreductase [Dehalococcoidia bacterium]|nr:SDR family oxidoreductase [Dehalococcoidia bacterium]